MNVRTTATNFYFRLDLRSLGLFRILLGALLIHDWVTRWPNLEAFYTAAGVLPLDGATSTRLGEFHFSLFDHLSSLIAVQAAFFAGLVCYTVLLLGYRPRLFLLLSLVFFVSVVNRNPLVRAHSDVVLVSMMLWAMFLPIGRRFSLDALWGRDEQGGTDWSQPSLAAFVVLLQLGLIYFLTAFAKHGEAWMNGTALYYAMHLELLTNSIGQWLGQQSLGIIKALTWGTLALEFVVLPLLLVPHRFVRRFLFVALTALQLGILSTMDIGHFPLVMITFHVLLIGPWDWKLIAVRKTEGDEIGAVKGWRRIVILLRDACVAVIFMAVLVNAYNFMTPRLGTKQIVEPALVRAIIQTPQIIQDWYMFAPDPSKRSLWWVLDGTTQAGRRIDPMTGSLPSWDKPENLAARYDRFWSYYLYRLTLEENEPYRRYFAGYLARKFERRYAEDPLVKLDFYAMRETILAPEKDEPFPVEQLLLGSYEFPPR